MELTPFFIVVLPILSVIAVGALGSTCRIGFWTALLIALLLTPIAGTIAALISGPKRLARRPIPRRFPLRA